MPVFYATNYNYGGSDNWDADHTGWYDMYQSIYNSEYPSFLGKYYAGSGHIIYMGKNSVLTTAAFNPEDEQAYYELPSQIERSFYYNLFVFDSTLSGVSYKEKGDSLVFFSADTSRFNGLQFVYVQQQVTLTEK